ncbi:MAG: hypothetical protein A2066_08645 [Bacteroidetes bacterium GWB2_41_8]|nr:MAG: hypothetical protein A2066_08645 [Bacteroidetes bacterium GWB2_41_8]
MGEFYITRYLYLSVISAKRQSESVSQQIIKPFSWVVNVFFLFVGFPTNKPAMEMTLGNLPVLDFCLKLEGV